MNSSMVKVVSSDSWFMYLKCPPIQVCLTVDMSNCGYDILWCMYCYVIYVMLLLLCYICYVVIVMLYIMLLNVLHCYYVVENSRHHGIHVNNFHVIKIVVCFNLRLQHALTHMKIIHCLWRRSYAMKQSTTYTSSSGHWKKKPIILKTLKIIRMELELETLLRESRVSATVLVMWCWSH